MTCSGSFNQLVESGFIHGPARPHEFHECRGLRLPVVSQIILHKLTHVALRCHSQTLGFARQLGESPLAEAPQLQGCP